VTVIVYHLPSVQISEFTEVEIDLIEFWFL